MNAAISIPSRFQNRAAGQVLDVVLRAGLLLLVLGQVVFLAGRYRQRVDLTGDKLYTLTESTQQVLSGLEDRLLIEAYFSKDSKLPAVHRERRRALDNFLDEYVQLGKGKVVVQRIDPQEDEVTREKAERLGIQPAQISDVGDASLAIKEIWQGLRIVYGADRQEIIRLLDFRELPWQYELEITPKIKAVTVKKKPKIGLLAFATEAGGGGMSPFGGGGGQPKGYNALSRFVKGHYEIQNVDLNDGRLVPDDIKTLLLVRPKNLTDRQKYALDQFLMGGNTLVVFADTAEFEIGAQRSMRSRKVNNDAADAKLKLVDQLVHYGIKIEDKVVGDGLAQSWRNEPFVIVQQTPLGAALQQLEYPYWFHALPQPWAELADQIAAQQPDNGGGEELAKRYRETFQPGLDLTNPVLKVMKMGPSMFWPCPVSLAEKLPEGVTGQVLLRTSPFGFAEDPPADLNPLGMDPNPRMARAAVTKFRETLNRKITSEPRRQIGLMAHVKGSFGSFFEGKEIPPRKKPEEPQPVNLTDPLAEPVQGLPGGPGGITIPPLPTGEAPKDGEVQEPAKDAGEPAKDGDEAPAPMPLVEMALSGVTQDPQGGNAAAGTAVPPPTETVPQPAVQDPGQIQGPPMPAVPKPEEPKDPDPVFKSAATAQLIVIGDADFLRDDLLPGDRGMSEEYGQIGPTSQTGPLFFTNMVDWLAEDQDLLALRNKTTVDRRIRLAEDDLMQSDRDQYLSRVKTRERLLTTLNVAGPVAAILVIWLLVSLRRRAQKQMFMASVQR